MEVDFPGKLQSLQSVPAGQILAFRLRGHLAIGIKLSSSARDGALIAIHRRDQPAKAPQILEGVPVPPFVLALPATVVLDSMPQDLRDGVPNPSIGNVLVSEAGSYLCVHDVQTHDYDPVLLDLTAGTLCSRTEGPTALFNHWKIVVRRGTDEEEVLLSYPPTTSQEPV